MLVSDECEVGPSIATSRVTGGLTIRSNFFWTFAGNVVYAGCQWGMLVAIAKIGSPEMVGRFVLGLALTAPVIMLTNLQLGVVQATDAKREYSFGDYLGLRIVATVVAVPVIMGIALASHRDTETVLTILAITIAKAFEAVSDIFYGLFQQRERLDRSSKSMILKGVLSLAAFAAALYVTRTILWGAVALAVVWATLLVVYDIPWGARLLRADSAALPGTDHRRLRELVRPRFERPMLMKLVRLALPLGIVGMLMSLQTNIPRYFVEHFMGVRKLGIFAGVAYLMMLGRLLIIALGQSASPRLARYYADGNGRAYRWLFVRLTAIGVALGAAGILIVSLAGRQLLTMLYSPIYAQYANVFTLTMIAAGISYVALFVRNAITAARYFTVQMPLLIGITIVLTLCSLRLIPVYGLTGAAWALIAAAIVEIVGNVAIFAHALSSLNKRAKQQERNSECA